MRRKKKVFRIMGSVIAVIFALIFIYPTIVTLADSFMSANEINVDAILLNDEVKIFKKAFFVLLFPIKLIPITKFYK